MRCHVEDMTSAGRLPGPSNPFAGLLKVVLALGAIAVGLFVFAVSATFLLFLVAAIAVVGLLAATFFWARARLTRRPFGPREQFEAMFADMQAEMETIRPMSPQVQSDGPVLDAVSTPDGWSVER